MFFEITITYWDDDTDSRYPKMKKFSDVIACKAENYTDAEAQATQWANENLDVDYVISPIKEIGVSEVHPNKEKGFWFLCKCIFLTVNDTNDKVKENKISYLVEAANNTEAGIITSKILKEEIINESRIVQISETKIKEFISC